MRAKYCRQGADEMIHLLMRMERGRCDPKAFRPARDGRVVDRLDVDPVLSQQVVRDAADQVGVADEDPERGGSRMA
jgi:hypothetical protein